MKALIKYVDNPTGFDSTLKNFRPLVEVNLDQFKSDYSPSANKLELTQQENQILNKMEDVNDSLTKEINKKRSKGSQNAVNIAFMDMS